jgi:hypothetical protein
MNNKPRLMAAAAALLLLTSCANTTIYPESNGTYSLVSTSVSQSAAEKDAKEKASKQCEKQGKHLVVLNHKSKYQGMNKADKAVIGLASTLLVGTNTTNSSDDYIVQLKFSCK